MTTFNSQNAYVWVWLPSAVAPVVCGFIERVGQGCSFYYGQSYLKLVNAIPLASHMPLKQGIKVVSENALPYCLQDALPDAWGQRVLNYKYHQSQLTPLDQLLLSSSDRIGALHFQSSSDKYIAKDENNTSLTLLQNAVEMIESGQPLPADLDIALMHGTSVGGARPKALITHQEKKYLAKFSSTTDIYPLVQYEYAAMKLAKKIGLHVAAVKLETCLNKHILLVERFDRVKHNNNWTRRFINSALTLLQLDELEGRYASYLDLADTIRSVCGDSIETLHELYRRLVFNILIGNTDDHAKNHAFFWDGHSYQLTPAYDICPYPRAGQEATQAMQVGKQGSHSTLVNVLSAAPWFELTENEAKVVLQSMVDEVRMYWPEICDQAKLSKQYSKQLMGTAVLNPYCFTGWETG